jgi:hypothetical protein
MGDGALYRIPPAAEGQPLGAQEVKLTGLNLAKGFVVDEARSEIFLSETLAGHVLAYKVDVVTGALGRPADRGRSDMARQWGKR